MYPWWLILLIVLGLALGLYLYYRAFTTKDDSEAVGYIALGSIPFGFAALGLLAMIFD